jgi:tRNA(fMet)-specific endonuclease VapC
LDRLLEGVIILDFTELACDRYGKIAAHLARRGTPIGEMDVLIAATAQVNGQTVYTRNLDHYRKIPGLQVAGY